MFASWLAVAALLAAAGSDAVLLKSGERIEGKIVGDSQAEGVRIQLPDGSIRSFHPRTGERVERAGGEPAPLTPAEPQPVPRPEPLPPLPVEPAPSGTPGTPPSAP